MKTEFIWIKDIREHPQYYVQMFGVKTTSKALGICVHYDDCYEWLLAIQNGVLLGFSGYETNSTSFVLKRAFVFEEYRRLGIYKLMLDLRIEKAVASGKKIIQATTTQMSKNEFEKRGFVTTKQYKQYQTWRKIL